MNAVVGILGKKAFKRLGNIETNSENPYKEKVAIKTNQRGEVTKWKEVERPLPEGLSANDQEILKAVRRKAYKWDMSFTLCCTKTKFGWSAIIGLIPFLGDALDLLVALFIVKRAGKVDGGLPKILYARMMWNIMLDFGIGLIPFVGDIADAFYRANTRNAWLLDAYLTEKAKALREGQVQNPDDGTSIAVPSELRASAPQAQTGRTRRPDVEMGFAPAQMPLNTNANGGGGKTPTQGRR